MGWGRLTAAAGAWRAAVGRTGGLRSVRDAKRQWSRTRERLNGTRVCVGGGGRGRGRAGGADREHGSIGQAAAPVADLPPLPPRRRVGTPSRVVGSPVLVELELGRTGRGGRGRQQRGGRMGRRGRGTGGASGAGGEGGGAIGGRQGGRAGEGRTGRQEEGRQEEGTEARAQAPAQVQAGGRRPAAGRPLPRPRPPTCGGQRLPAVAVRGGKEIGFSRM